MVKLTLVTRDVGSQPEANTVLDYRVCWANLSRSDLASAIEALRGTWMVSEMLMVGPAKNGRPEPTVHGYDEMQGKRLPSGLRQCERHVDGVVLTRPKQTIIINHGHSPLLILSSRNGIGPVVVLRATLDNLVPEKGRSIIDLCLSQYLKVWGGPESVRVDFTRGHHYVPLPEQDRLVLISQSYSRVYREAMAIAGRLELFTRDGVSLAIILVTQLGYWGISAKDFLRPIFNGGNGLTFVTRKS